MSRAPYMYQLLLTPDMRPVGCACTVLTAAERLCRRRCICMMPQLGMRGRNCIFDVECAVSCLPGSGVPKDALLIG